MKFKKHIFDLLKKVGLTESEIKFYLAAYKNPKLTIKDLQNICGLSRASAYRIFESLKEKKFLTSSLNNWRKNIEAISLRSLAEKLAREQRKLGKVELEIKRLDNLMNLTNYNGIEEPVEFLFDRNEIIEHCYEMLNKEWSHLLCYGSAERLIDILGNTPESNFVRLRYKKGKTCDAIFTEYGDYTREIMPNNQEELRNVKLRVDTQNQNFMTYTYGNEVTIWHKDEEIGERAIIIRDRGLAKLYENNFKLLWNKNNS